MLRKSVFITFFLLVVMVLAPLQGQCENWKDYFKDSEYIYYYDKDSIHYPIRHKNIFGIMVTDKSIVKVWLRDRIKSSGERREAFVATIYCATRKYAVQDSDNNLAPWELPWELLKNSNGIIEPSSMWESILKKVCP